MRIEEILRDKGRDVVTIRASQMVLEAVEVLVARNIGALPVVDGARLTGIITERDILQLTARSPGELGAIQVGAVMTREPITATPLDELADMMNVMTERRIRHLPLVDEGQLAGIVSIGDLLKACQVEAEQENHHLREYIGGVAESPPNL